jgi:pilus assembly protein CpaE
MSTSIQIPALNEAVLSIAIIGPDERRRMTLASEIAGCQSGPIREFFSYPPGLHYVQDILDQDYDVIFIDIESEPDYAIDLVEKICANGSSTVIVYSPNADQELMIRSMQAGAREFLTVPTAAGVVAEALGRAAVRRPPNPAAKKPRSRMFVFLGAKGGCGATTIACNFAVSLALDFCLKTLLIDLDLPLGDAALNLGIDTEYSTLNALQNSARLDQSFLSSLLTRHHSSLQVLGAPGKFPFVETTNDAIDRLLSVARKGFDNVVVDAGSRLDPSGTALLNEASIIYLVTQGSIPELRNASRLTSEFFPKGGPHLEIVLNRFQPGVYGIDEEEVANAFARPVNWTIPNDYSAVRQMQHTATPFSLQDSPITRAIRRMASTACGLPDLPEKKKKFSFFR